MGRTEPTEKAATARNIWRRNYFANKMPETTVPVSLRDAFLEDPFFRTGWDEMNSECREMRSFAEGNNTLATMDRSWPLLPKQWMLPQLFQDFRPARDEGLADARAPRGASRRVWRAVSARTECWSS